MISAPQKKIAVTLVILLAAVSLVAFASVSSQGSEPPEKYEDGYFTYFRLNDKDWELGWYRGDNAVVTVPETFQKDGVAQNVVSIGENGFAEMDQITTINLPKSIRSIKMDPFWGCSLLNAIHVDDDNSNYESDSGLLFTKNGETLVKYPQARGNTSYEIKGTVKTIGDFAFAECGNLVSVDVKEVNSIGIFAFGDCGSLRVIKMEKAESIGNHAFQECASLEKIDMPEVKSIGKEAFAECGKLHAVGMPKVVTIGDSAFLQTALIRVEIPSSANSIGAGVFLECNDLMAINVSSENNDYLSIDGVLFSKKDELIKYPPKKPGDTYTVPESANVVCDNAFSKCNSLKTVNMSSVTEIGESSFELCGLLEAVDMPSVVTIGNHAFSDCTLLGTVNMPSAATIGDYAFFECAKLTAIEAPSAVTIGESSFGVCTALKSADMPKAKTVGGQAFRVCEALERVDMPSLESLGGSAFLSCKELRSVSFPSLKTIDNAAFHGCEKLESVEMPSVTKIGNRAFLDCKALAKVAIPSCTESIGKYPFHGCASLTEISVDRENAWYSSAQGVLFTKKGDSLLQYPMGKGGETYAVPTHTLTIEDSAFSGCPQLQAVTMPSVKTIAPFAFERCKKLQSVDIPAVKALEQGAFYECESLKTMTILAGIETVSPSAFKSCDNLKAMVFQENAQEKFPKFREWKIGEAELDVIVFDTTDEFDITGDYSGDGKFLLFTKKTEKVSISLDGGELLSGGGGNMFKRSGNQWKSGGTAFGIPSALPLTYNGAMQSCGITGTTDYTISGTIEGQDAGIYKATITQVVEFYWENGIKGNIDVFWTIAPLDLSGAVTIEDVPEHTYEGEPISPVLVVKHGDKILEEGKDYLAFFTDNDSPGKATATVRGIGNYTGELSTTFGIKGKPWTSNTMLIIAAVAVVVAVAAIAYFVFIKPKP